MKLINLVKPLVGGILFLFSASSFANTGWCTPEKGTMDYGFSFDKTYTDPLQNKIGTLYQRTAPWDLGTVYYASCDCTRDNVTFFKTTVPGLTATASRNGLNFYTLNKYLEVATEVWIDGMATQYFATPFNSVSNINSNTCGRSAFRTGSKGYVSLYIANPFVGQLVIPRTKILDLFGTKVRDSFGGIPMSSVYMSGTVTVPQSCDINAGQVINIDFGNLTAKDIKTKGENATGFIPRVVNMTVACNNISEGVKISLSINGDAASGDPTALATSNNDIGVRILDATGNAISPNDGHLPVAMNYAAQTGTSSMSLAPMNVTGNAPPSGEFTATATIRAEIQ